MQFLVMELQCNQVRESTLELGNITILPYIVIFAFDIVFNLQYRDIVFK